MIRAACCVIRDRSGRGPVTDHAARVTEHGKRLVFVNMWRAGRPRSQILSLKVYSSSPLRLAGKPLVTGQIHLVKFDEDFVAVALKEVRHFGVARVVNEP